MSRLTQFFQNTYIRLEAFFGAFFKSIFNFFGNIFRFFAGLFGFSNSQYFLEPDAAQGIKRNTTQESIEESQPAKTAESQNTMRPRRPNPQMDYFRKMAEEVKKS